MPTIKKRMRRIFVGVVLLGSILTPSGCSNDTSYTLDATGAAPSVTGKVSVSEDNLGNTRLDIEVRNLREDGVYLAWARQGERIAKLGALNIDGKNGELIATTDLERFTVFVTSEKSEELDKPANVPIVESQPIAEE